MNHNPIGIFDSGLGGLSVLQQVCKLLPNETIFYVADSAHAPYGCKDERFVEQRSRYITEKLLEQGAGVIVIACNTATASIIDRFRQDYGIPFVGVEPGIKPAVQLTQNARVGVLATTATIASERYQQLIQRYAQSIKLYSQACPGLADKVEQGAVAAADTRALLNTYLQPLLQQDIDTLVLGCTHYSFLSDTIREMVNTDITLVDTSRAVADQLSRIIGQDENKTISRSPAVHYFTTGSVSASRQAIKTLLELDVPVNHF